MESKVYGVVRTLLIWSASSVVGRENLAYGLQTRTWGLRSLPAEVEREQDLRYVIFGRNFSRGNVRSAPDWWSRSKVDLMLCEFSSPFYQSQAPHWPDERRLGSIEYPYRFGLTYVASASDVPLSGALAGAPTDALRLAAIGSKPHVVDLAEDDLTILFGVELQGGRPVDRSRTSGATVPSDEGDDTVPGGQGRTSDPDLNAAVERRAVELAIQHVKSLGWREVEELGRPFDLVCRRDGQEKHVEVKGTTGAGTEVLYTPNEVDHFRSCPFGADLIVVRDIQVDRSRSPYRASGGRLLHVPDYKAPPEDLQATGWSGRVYGW